MTRKNRTEIESDLVALIRVRLPQGSRLDHLEVGDSKDRRYVAQIVRPTVEDPQRLTHFACSPYSMEAALRKLLVRLLRLSDEAAPVITGYKQPRSDDMGDLTEEQIERIVEKRTDAIDKKLMDGKSTPAEYDADCRAIRDWADQQYAKLKRVP